MIPVLAAAAAGESANAILNIPRQAVEKADFRATGHLVRVDPGGTRTSYPISLKAHWFPGVLRVLVEVAQPSGSTPATAHTAPVHVLLELRPKWPNYNQGSAPGRRCSNAPPSGAMDGRPCWDGVYL